MKEDRKDRIIEILLASGFISGEVISSKLGISRVMVNRYIKELQYEGFDIEINKYKGYKLKNTPDKLYPSLVKHNNPEIQKYKFLIFDELLSTNTYCLNNSQDLDDRTVVIANYQTQGKGRMGREWVSEKDKDITMSILMKPGCSVNEVIRYTVSLSLAVLDAIRDFDIDEVFIKWPNDIYYKDKKICGVLTETTIQYDTGIVENLVIGVGLNVNSTPSKFIPSATSLFEILGFEIKRTTIINKILGNFERNISTSYEVVFDRWKENIGFIGKKVVVRHGNEEIRCRFVDVSKTGEIIVEDNNTIRKFGFGEVSLIVG